MWGVELNVYTGVRVLPFRECGNGSSPVFHVMRVFDPPLTGGSVLGKNCICLLCFSYLTYNPSTKGGGATSNLISHLNTRHKRFCDDSFTAVLETRITDVVTATEIVSAAQLTLQSSLSRGKLSQAEKALLVTSFVLMLVADLRPLYWAESDALAVFLSMLSTPKKYEPPCPRAIRSTIYRLAEQARALLGEKLSKATAATPGAPALSLVTDIWTDQYTTVRNPPLACSPLGRAPSSASPLRPPRRSAATPGVTHT